MDRETITSCGRVLRNNLERNNTNAFDGPAYLISGNVSAYPKHRSYNVCYLYLT